MCNCIELVNKELAKNNTILDEISLWNFKTGKVRQSLHVATKKLARKRGKAKIVCVTFCPFCGKRAKPKAA